MHIYGPLIVLLIHFFNIILFLKGNSPYTTSYHRCIRTTLYW